LAKAIVGTWHAEYAGDTPYAIRLEFAAGDDAKISVRIGKEWSHIQAKYKVRDGSTMDIRYDIGNNFTPNYRTDRYEVTVAADRSTLKIKGRTQLTLKRVP
jgi:hypothetical protein